MTRSSPVSASDAPPDPAASPGGFGDPQALARLAAVHYENFPVGSWLIPRAERPHMHRVYAFARTADDIADERRDAALLAAFRAAFVAHLAGTAPVSIPLFADLVQTIHDRDLPPGLFLALLDAFQQDLEQSRYPDRAALLDYCTRSADPVGRIVLRIFVRRDPALDALSDRICTGLQLVNHLQDIGEDLRDRDRIYFPRTDLDRFGVTEADLRADRATDGVRALVLHWLDDCADMLRDGWPLIGRVPGRLRLELRAIVAGAAAVITSIRAADGDVLSRPRRLSKPARLGAVLRGALWPTMPGGIRRARP